MSPDEPQPYPPVDHVDLANVLSDTVAALNGTLDLDEVLDLILTNVGFVMPHDAADIMLIEDGAARVVRENGFSQRGLGDWIFSLRLSVADTPNLKQMQDTGQPVCVPDLQANPNWLHIPAGEWQCSYAGAPLIYRGHTLGFLNLTSIKPNFYTPAQADQLLVFAHQAATAIQNARLFQETQRRLAAQTALLNASSAISSTLDLPTVLQRCAEQSVPRHQCHQRLHLLLELRDEYDRGSRRILQPLGFRARTRA